MPSIDHEGYSELLKYADNAFAGDEKLNVSFYKGVVLDEEASKAAKRRVFREADFIRIYTPGDKDNIIDQPVDEVHIRRFGPRYEAWKEGRQQEEGTPLAAWPGIPRALVEELKYFHVVTLEQLVGMSDANAAKFPGIRALQTAARDFLAAAKEGSQASAVRTELEELRARLAQLEGGKASPRAPVEGTPVILDASGRAALGVTEAPKKRGRAKAGAHV